MDAKGEAESPWAPGDVIKIINGVGTGSEAVVTEVAANYCTVVELDDDRVSGLRQLWPSLHQIESVSKTWRVGARVHLQGLTKSKLVHFNGVSGVVAKHPREGHPVWWSRRGPEGEPVGDPHLQLVVRVDKCFRTAAGSATVRLEAPHVHPAESAAEDQSPPNGVVIRQAADAPGQLAAEQEQPGDGNQGQSPLQLPLASARSHVEVAQFATEPAGKPAAEPVAAPAAESVATQPLGHAVEKAAPLAALQQAQQAQPTGGATPPRRRMCEENSQPSQESMQSDTEEVLGLGEPQGSPSNGLIMSSRRSFDEADIELLEKEAQPAPDWQQEPISRPWFGRQVEFCVGEELSVLTDDGKEWMDAVVIAFFPADCVVEGYRVPAGTVKVSYKLGVKWIMARNIHNILRRKVDKSATSRRWSFGSICSTGVAAQAEQAPERRCSRSSSHSAGNTEQAKATQMQVMSPSTQSRSTTTCCCSCATMVGSWASSRFS